MQALNLIRYIHEDLIRFLLAWLVYVKKSLAIQKESHPLLLACGHNYDVSIRRSQLTLTKQKNQQTRINKNKNQQKQHELFYEVAALIDESE